MEGLGDEADALDDEQPSRLPLLPRAEGTDGFDGGVATAGYCQ